MGDISNQLQNVWAAIAHSAGGTGANIMFASSGTSRLGMGADCSEIAREFAKLAASRAAKSVLLMDLDLVGNTQFQALGGNNYKWQGPFDLSLSSKTFWRIVPRDRSNTDVERKAIVGYRVGNSRLFVSKCRHDVIGENQSLQLGSNTNYWNNLKGTFEVCVVDTPPLDSSKAALAIASDMDGVILVVDNNSDPRDAVWLRDTLHSHGANILGVVVIQHDTNKKRAKKVA